MSSWIESWAGKAENFLNLVDKAAGEALQQELSEPAPIPIEWDSHYGVQTGERAFPLPRYVSPQQLYGNRSSGQGAYGANSVSVPHDLNQYQSFINRPTSISHSSSSAFTSHTVETTPPPATTTSRTAPVKGNKDKDAELFEFLNSDETITPRLSPAPPVSTTPVSQNQPVKQSSAQGSRSSSSLDVDYVKINSESIRALHEPDGRTLSLEQENNLLKYEVSNLNQELNSMIARGNKVQAELDKVRDSLGGSEGRGVMEERRELKARLVDMQEAVRVKDAQLAVLRVRLEEADRDLSCRRNEADQLQTNNEQIQQSSGGGSSSQIIESLKVRLTETELLLEHEHTTHQQFQEESMEKLNILEAEKQKLSAEVGSALRQLEEEKGRSAELSAQQKIGKSLLENSKQELSDYKEKAMRILQSKERLITSLREGGGMKGSGGEGNVSAAELEGLRQERDMMREELHQTRLTLETARLEVTELENQLQQDQSGLQLQMKSLEERLTEESNKLHDTEQELNKQKQEVSKARSELNKQTKALQSRLEDRDSEINRLRNQLTTKSLSTNSQEELEGRLHLLTESLIQKQTMLETLSTEKNSLQLQLERMERQYREAEASAMRASSSSVQLSSESPDTRHRTSAGLLTELPSDSAATRHVKSAAVSIDRLSVRIGVFLRRSPVARILVFLYMILLHFWLMFIMMTYHQEIHAANYDHQPVPPANHKQ